MARTYRKSSEDWDLMVSQAVRRRSARRLMDLMRDDAAKLGLSVR